MDGFAHDWPTPTRTDTNALQMDLVTELRDGGFEPQTRARSNTWPCPRPENFVDPPDEVESTKASNQHLAGDSQQATPNVSATKKNSSRRNAWGNLSYADLITHAIGSATDKRLTLSQIYEWMVHNVPYFKDKGDSNSSAGWKNSIRHNLSLHNRFMRVQNEGTGKSSWWMLNPDAKQGKSVRRRAASMETSRYEKRRGRAKKRVEALRQAGVTGLNDNTPSPSSSISEGLDHFPESPLHSGFPISPDFRQRASSNASSCGRLSPIQTVVGLDFDWGFSPDYQNSAPAATVDKLAGSMAEELTLQKDLLQQQQQGFNAGSGMPTQPPTPYPNNTQQQTAYNLTRPLSQGYNNLANQQCMLHRSLTCACLHTTTREGLSPNSVTAMSPAYQNSEPSSDSLNTYTSVVIDGQSGVSSDNSGSNGLMVQQQQQLQQQTQQLSSNLEDNNCASTLIGQYLGALNNEPAQIEEFNIENFQGGLECNIEELMQQEINIDGLLDINIPLTAVTSSTVSNSVCNNGLMVGGSTTNTAAIGLTAQQQLNHLQAQLQQQQHLQQQHQQQLQQQQQQQQLPSMLNNNTTMATGLELTTQTPAANLNARVQYSQQNVVTPPSWVH